MGIRNLFNVKFRWMLHHCCVRSISRTQCQHTHSWLLVDWL